MKLVHLCLGCFYIDNSTYQENLLPKYHKDIGYDVEIIASPLNQKDGKFIINNKYRIYENEHGIRVTRLKYKGLTAIAKKLCQYDGLYEALERAKPEILYIHGPQSVDAAAVVRYLKKHPKIEVYVDNHVDFMNSARNILSREILHKRMWKHSVQILNPYVKKFYGVLPARVDFLTNTYMIPPKKVELLVLGVDDDILAEVEKNGARQKIREEYQISDDTTLVVTGGKINRDRPETLQLIEAVSKLQRPDIQLLIFGDVEDGYKAAFDELCKSPFIHYVGWVSTKEIYEYFQSGDLIAFPGLHSVLWEQAVGSGKACIFRKMDGFMHVDIGGNCGFFKDLSSDSIEKQLADLVDTGQIKRMTQVAQEKGKEYFSYRNIAEYCIDCTREPQSDMKA